MALQRRRAHAVAIDDAARVYEAIEELATDVLASGASAAVVADDFLFQVGGPFGSQSVVVLFRLVAEDLCAKHSDAISTHDYLPDAVSDDRRAGRRRDGHRRGHDAADALDARVLACDSVRRRRRVDVVEHGLRRYRR